MENTENTNRNRKVDNGSEEIITRITRRNLDPELPKINLPNDTNSCVKCPNAMWLYENNNAKAFCRITHENKYISSINSNVQFCAGVRIS